MFVKRTTSLFLRNIKRKRKKIGEEVPVKKSKPSLKHVREIKKKSNNMNTCEAVECRMQKKGPS